MHILFFLLSKPFFLLKFPDNKCSYAINNPIICCYFKIITIFTFIKFENNNNINNKKKILISNSQLINNCLLPLNDLIHLTRISIN